MSAGSRTTLICEPKWEIPDDDVVEMTMIEERYYEKFERYHIGLCGMSFTSAYRNDVGMPIKENSFQRINVRNGAAGVRPAIDSKVLAKYAWLRCVAYARDRKRRVQFKVELRGLGTDPDVPDEQAGPEDRWRHTVGWTIDGTGSIDEDNLMEAKVDPNAPAHDLRHILPPADHERIMPDLQETDVATRRPMAVDVMGRGGDSMGSEIAVQLARLESKIDHQPAVLIHEVCAVLQQVRMESSAAVRDMAISTREILESQAKSNADMMRGSSESTAAVLRESSQAFVRLSGENNLLMNRVLDEIAERDRYARTEIAKAHAQVTQVMQDRIESVSNADTGSSKRAWDAFERAMDMQEDAGRKILEAKQEELSTALERVRSPAVAAAPTASPIWSPLIDKVVQFMPTAVLLAGSRFHQMGWEPGAQAAAAIAEKMVGSGGPPPDELEPGEEEGESEAPAAAPQAPAAPTPQPVPQRPRMATRRGGVGDLPLLECCGRLRSSLTPAQVEELQKGMPPVAWQGFESAAKATSEMAVVPCLIPLGQAATQDPRLEPFVRSVLDTAQAELFDRVIDLLGQKFGRPPRAQAAPARPRVPTPS